MGGRVKLVDADATSAALASLSTVQSNALSPTADIYGRFEYAYRHFNHELFFGRLPDCILTLTRRKRTLGYFGADFFVSADGGRAHELAMNPAYLEMCGDYATCSILVHEQAHLARHEFGPANSAGGTGARGYHDQPWADLMLSLGLQPTDDGKPTGKMTGYAVSHLIIPGGRFDVACQALLATGFEFRWRDFYQTVSAGGERPNGGESKSTRAKYTCPSCGQNAWAKLSAQLVCGACTRPLVRA